MPCSPLASHPSTEAQCAYGSLPGRWRTGADGRRRWQLLDKRCQLADVLQPRIDAARKALADLGEYCPDSLVSTYAYLYYIRSSGRFFLAAEHRRSPQGARQP